MQKQFRPKTSTRAHTACIMCFFAHPFCSILAVVFLGVSLLLDVNQIRGVSLCRLFSPLPPYGTRLFLFIARRTQIFLPSRRLAYRKMQYYLCILRPCGLVHGIEVLLSRVDREALVGFSSDPAGRSKIGYPAVSYYFIRGGSEQKRNI